MKSLGVFTIFTFLVSGLNGVDYINLWEDRYAAGGNSGAGSYGLCAEFKAEIINAFIVDHKIKSVVDFGCGDGEQLKSIQCQEYLGLDVSKTAVKMCIKKYENDKSKSFMLYDPNIFDNKGFIKSDLAICLDVLYHVIDDNDFIKTLDHIFSFGSDYVILYTTLHAYPYEANSHIKHREIFDYLKKYSDFEIVAIMEQRNKHLSSADFIVLHKVLK